MVHMWWLVWFIIRQTVLIFIFFSFFLSIRYGCTHCHDWCRTKRQGFYYPWSWGCRWQVIWNIGEKSLMLCYLFWQMLDFPFAWSNTNFAFKGERHKFVSVLQNLKSKFHIILKHKSHLHKIYCFLSLYIFNRRNISTSRLWMHTPNQQIVHNVFSLTMPIRPYSYFQYVELMAPSFCWQCNGIVSFVVA